MVATAVRARWAAGEPALGAWLFLREPLIAQAASIAGYDYVCIDLQHGVAGYEHLNEMLAAITTGTATPLVRVPQNESWMIGRALDAGAMGVIVPMVNSAAEAERAVAACRYAPVGERSIGPIGAMTRHGSAYVRTANDDVLCIVMIETAAAVDRIDEIVAVPGVDAVYVGPADLSLTIGLPPATDHVDQRFVDALHVVAASCGSHGKVAGVHANAKLGAERFSQGFRLITVGFDHGPVVAALRQDLETSRDGVTDR